MGNCHHNTQPDHLKKTTAEITPSDFLKRRSATTGSSSASSRLKPAGPETSSTEQSGTPPSATKRSDIGRSDSNCATPNSSGSNSMRRRILGDGKLPNSTGSTSMRRLFGGGTVSVSEASATKQGTPSPTVLLYGHPTSELSFYLRYALQFKPVTLEFYPTIFELSLFTLEFGKNDVVSGSTDDMLRLMDAKFPHPNLLTQETKPELSLRKISELQHSSLIWHLDRLVKWGTDLSARGGKTAVDPGVGTPRMEVKKFGKSYSQLLDVMLEHAQMEERVIFPILLAADRGLCKTANSEHARDLPVMNGIKEALKSIAVLDAGTSDHREALNNLSSRLELLQENTREHFEEEELNVFPLLEAASELSKEEQKKVLAQCVDTMQETHSQHFKFFMEGLLPHEAVQYMDLILHCLNSDATAAMFRRLVE